MMSAFGRCFQDGDTLEVVWFGVGLQRCLLQVVEVWHPGAGGSGKSGSILPWFDAKLFGGELSTLRPL